MEYTSFDTIPYYTDCAPIVKAAGYVLVELRVFRTNGTIQIRAVISHADTSVKTGIGIDDCAKVHRVLLPRLEAILDSQDTYMEVTSPGTERNIKNAAEFAFFKEKYIKVYDISLSDWVSGQIIDSDENQLKLKIEDAERSIPLEQISKAKLLNS